MIVVIDNYDSFTYNLVQYLGSLGQDVQVFRNNKITIAELEALKPDRIVISPGPGWPQDAGVTIALIQHFAPKVPILGICLGHQAIGQAFRARVELAPQMMHGKSSPVFHTKQGLFKNIPNPIRGGRYHSLVVASDSLPAELRVTAQTADELVMSVQHVTFPTYGIQFHPESILTENGMQLLENFLHI